MRDLRDPQKMGEWYLKLRANGMPIEEAVEVGVAPYENGPFISSDPAEHHSKTPQNIDLQEPSDNPGKPVQVESLLDDEDYAVMNDDS